MKHGAPEGQALLPSPGKLGGQAMQIQAEAVELNDLFHAAFETRRIDAVNAAIELQILLDG